MQQPVPAPDLQGVRPSLVQLTHVIYGLHAFSVLTGIWCRQRHRRLSHRLAIDHCRPSPTT